MAGTSDRTSPRARAATEALDRITHGVVAVDSSLSVLFANDAAARVTGMDLTQIVGRPVAEVITELDGTAFVDAAHRALQLQHVVTVEDVSPTGRRLVQEFHPSPDGVTIILRDDLGVTPADGGAVVGSRAEDVHAGCRAMLDEVDQGIIEARERMLLAEAIHDDPLQLLTAAMLRLDSLQSQVPPATGLAVEQVAVVLDQAMERLRRLVETLHPPDLEAGLGAALQAYAQAIFIEDVTAIEVRGPREVPLPASSMLAAYAVLREALANARKHARARHVVITTALTPTSVTLSVQDDGVGTDTRATTSGHMGLPTMRARAKALGAGLSVSSRAGQGTTVTLSVPLARDEEPARPS